MTDPVPPHLRLGERLMSHPSIELSVGLDRNGAHLVVAVPGRNGPCWISAPVTPLAIDCVREGRTTPWAVLHHSTTGTVTVTRTRVDGGIADSVILCAKLPEGAAMLAAA